MLEWLEVRLDVWCDKRLVYEYRIERLLLLLLLNLYLTRLFLVDSSQ